MYKVLLIAMFFSIKGFASDLSYFEDNSNISTSENTELDPSNPPVEMEPVAPISDYQYLLLSAAVALGIIYKYKK